MPDYRVYFIGSDGRISRAEEIDCADDPAAIATAKQIMNGHDVELWERARRVGLFRRDDAAPTAQPVTPYA